MNWLSDDHVGSLGWPVLQHKQQSLASRLMAQPGTAVPSYDKTGFSLTSPISFGRGVGSLPDCAKDGCPIRKIRGAYGQSTSSA
jgi:hypothetical protein